MTYVLADWVAIAPLVVLLLTALALFLVDSIRPQQSERRVLVGVASVGLLATLATTIWFLVSGTGQHGQAITLFMDQLVVDGTSLFFTVIFTSVALLAVIASYDYVTGHPHQGEYFSLIVLATTGMALMASANSLVVIFIAFELASLPSYALVAYLKRNRGSVEAGLKYFLIGALSSAIFLYGISLVYVTTGTLQLNEIAMVVPDVENVGLLGIGVVMIIGGLAFKTASVPFHFWAPEAYEGAPTPISAFLSSASKAAGFVIAFRILIEAFPLSVVQDLGIDWVLVLQALAIVTMLVGNLAALTQENVKRMLAYSSVGHAGYVLIGLAALTNPNGANELVVSAAMMHLLVYGMMNTGAFLFVALAEHSGVGRTFDDYNGLWRKAPVASVAITIFLFSLAGLPIGGGFLSKLVLFMAAVSAGFWWLAAVGVLASVISLFYYARLVKAIWIDTPTTEHDLGGRPVGIYVAILVAAIATVLLLPGFFVVAEYAQIAAVDLLG